MQKESLDKGTQQILHFPIKTTTNTEHELQKGSNKVTSFWGRGSIGGTFGAVGSLLIEQVYPKCIERTRQCQHVQ